MIKHPPLTQVTHDYSLFKFLKGNRHINSAHCEALKKSLLNKPMLHIRPILVNSKYEIIDGQHRFQASKELGEPIYYIIEPDADYNVAIALNANSKNWGIGDYVDMFAEQGCTQYSKLVKFAKDNDVNLDIALCVILNQRPGGQFSRNLKKGIFEHDFDELKLAESIAKCKNFIDFIKVRNRKDKLYLSTKNFWLAVMRFMNHPDVDWSKFLEKVELNLHLLGPQSQIKRYLQTFMAIYNHKKKNKITMKGI